MALRGLPSYLLTVCLAVVVMASVVSCGGGGGGGGSTGGAAGTGGSPAQPAPSMVVSGTVLAPGGGLAFYGEPGFTERIARLFVSSAFASLTGLAAVPDGAVVELARIDSAGNTQSVIATTTVSGGAYSFDLTSLGVSLANNLVVQVRNQNSGVTMRAFVVSETVQLDPVSEATVRLVLEKAGNQAQGLNVFTVKELSDLVGAARAVTTLQQVSAGVNLDNAVTAIRGKLDADSSFTSFVAAAETAGQTTEGPGDIGEYYPVGLGIMWKYSVSESTGASYTNAYQVTGTRIVRGVQTTVVNETNPGNQGVPRDNYVVKNSAGVTSYGDSAASGLANQLSPTLMLQFPVVPGSSFVQADRSGFDCGSDIDGDGKHETCSIHSVVTIVGFETVTVQSRTFANSARVRTSATLIVKSSRYGTTATENAVDTAWYAPGVGQVKGTTVRTVGNRTSSSSMELTEFFKDGNWWSDSPYMTVSPMPTKRAYGKTVVLNGKVYVIGGQSAEWIYTVDVYNPATNTWATPTTMPCQATIMDVGVMNGKIFMTIPDPVRVYIYDPVANSWKTAAPAPAFVGGHMAVPVNGKLYFWEGLDLYAYDPATDSWALLGRKPGIALIPIDYGDVSRAAVMDGKIYVAGDFTRNTMSIYDVATGTWSATPSMSQNKHGGYLLSYGGKIYYAGGQTANSVITKAFEVYDPSTNSWTVLAPMPVTSNYGALLPVNGKIHLVAGYAGNGQGTDAVYAYDPVLNTWTQKTPLPLGRTAFESAVVNGRLLIMGGVTDSFNFTKTDRVDEYDSTKDH